MTSEPIPLPGGLSTELRHRLEELRSSWTAPLDDLGARVAAVGPTPASFDRDVAVAVLVRGCAEVAEDGAVAVLLDDLLTRTADGDPASGVSERLLRALGTGRHLDDELRDPERGDLVLGRWTSCFLEREGQSPVWFALASYHAMLGPEGEVAPRLEQILCLVEDPTERLAVKLRLATALERRDPPRAATLLDEVEAEVTPEAGAVFVALRAQRAYVAARARRWEEALAEVSRALRERLPAGRLGFALPAAGGGEARDAVAEELAARIRSGLLLGRHPGYWVTLVGDLVDALVSDGDLARAEGLRGWSFVD